MSRGQVRAFGAIMVLGAVMSTALTSVHAGINLNLSSSCPSGFANFGDSFTDTGNVPDAFPFSTDVENPPYGETFFGKPAKRFCNGRLVPDFFSLAFQKPLLDAYFAVASFNYKYGINFASSGATAVSNPIAISPFSVTPFQTSEFIRFQNSVAATQKQPGCINFNLKLPSKNPWSSWLYTIKTGGNDILIPIIVGTPLSVINSTNVPQAVNGIVTAILTLYQRGARKFLVSGIAPSGCSPIILTILRNQSLQKDNFGCIDAVNSIVRNFNSQLLSKIKLLRTNLTGAEIAYFDYYTANIEILMYPRAYGFNPALTQIACCGAPGTGTFNYNSDVHCGHPALGSNNCANPDEHINWDGIHFTEAFYRVIASFMLNGYYTDGGVNYSQLCNLDFSKWDSGVTFQQAYPFQTCNNLFT